MSKNSSTQITNDALGQIQSAKGTSGAGSFAPAGRWVVENGTRRWYTGEGLVGGEQIQRDYYDLTLDTNQIYAAMSPSQRVALMKRLVDGGFLSASGVGDVSSEINGLEKLLYYSNIVGRVWQEAIGVRLSSLPIQRSGGQRRVQVTNTDDLVKIAKTVAQNTIGRELTDAEAGQFASAYQQQEVSSVNATGGRMMGAPSVDVAAEQYIQQIKPQESAGYKYLGYMNQLFNSIGEV
jgi:hypothetical protein